jgi:bifunctional DNA-binding transcriptional regulator/antitoxin component of YhaV-PrlF toxin-antitoxin module
MASSVVRNRGQWTIPADIRKAAQIDEGDVLEAEIVENGILLRVRKVIDASQAWFWAPEWQQREQQADADIDAGRFDRYESDEAFLAALDERMKPLDADS